MEPTTQFYLTALLLIAGTAEDGSATLSLAPLVAGDTSVDTMSNIGRRAHSAAQDGFAQILEVQKPQLIWVRDSLVGAYSGKGYVADDFIQRVSMEIPALLRVDSAGDGVDEVHIYKVDDGWPASDDGCWIGQELTADQIESFSPLNPLTSDPNGQFSDPHGRGVLHSLPFDVFGRLGGIYVSVLFDSTSAFGNAGVAEDGFITPSLAHSVAGDTTMDTMSDDGRRARSATQKGFAQTLELQKRQLIWERDSFLSASFEKGNVVDNLIPHVSIERPATLPVDLAGDEVDAAPSYKALRRGQFKSLYSRSIKQSAVVHEETQSAIFTSGWTSIVLLKFSAFATFDRVRCESLEAETRTVVYKTVVECLSRKATSTVGKRLGAMRRFAEFWTARALPPFPLVDSCIHAGLLWLSTDSHARGSSGKSFWVAASFARLMLGLRSRELQLVSQHVTGLTDSLVKHAPVIEQEIALTVEQIKRTEMICCNSESLQDRVLVGSILLMIHGSTRASDMARAMRSLFARDVRQLNEREANEPEGFVELAVLGNKGARNDVHRRLPLPVVDPMVSLRGAKQWDVFLGARIALGQRLLMHRKCVRNARHVWEARGIGLQRRPR